MERLFKRKRLVGERRVGPMTMRADGDERTDSVVGRLHEMRWAQQVFAFATQRLQKFLRALHARRSALLQCRFRHHRRAFQQPSHTSGLERCEEIAEIRVVGAYVGFVVRHAVLHPVVAERTLDGNLCQSFYIDRCGVHVVVLIHYKSAAEISSEASFPPKPKELQST